MTTRISLSQLVVPVSNVEQSLVIEAGAATLTAANSPIPVILDDISSQFDGAKTVFDLTVDLQDVSAVINNSIVDSKDLDVSVNGSVVAPYVTQVHFPWILDYDSFRGFRVKGSKIIFFQSPRPGTQCTIILRNISSAIQQRRYPFTAGGIALGV
jgi:hypothetical protein